MSSPFWVLFCFGSCQSDYSLICYLHQCGDRPEWSVISSGSQKISSEIVPRAVLITNGVEEGSLGMMTTFCCHDQAKVESLEVLSTLHQQDSPEPSMVVVRIFANSPYLP